MDPQILLQDAVNRMLPQIEGVKWVVEVNQLAGHHKKTRLDVVASMVVDLESTAGVEEALSKIHQITSNGQVELHIERLHE